MTKRLTICLLFLCALLAASTGSQPLTLGSSPAQVPCSSPRYVQEVSFYTMPGSTGKVFIGTSALDTSTLDGALAILYPNPTGVHSEHFDFPSAGNPQVFSPVPAAADAGYVDLCNFYVAGGVPGEKVLMSTQYRGNGSVAASGLWQIVRSGTVGRSAGQTYGTALASSSSRVNVVRVQVIPGNTGKVAVGNLNYFAAYYDGTHKVLWPNQGTPAEHNAWSEVYTQGHQDIDLASTTVWPYDSTEKAIAAAWKRYTASQAQGTHSFVATTQTTPTALSASLPSGYPLTHTSVRIRMIPGAACGKVYIGKSASMDPSNMTGVLKVLWPNCSGGHSEEFELTPAFNQGGDLNVAINLSTIYVQGQFAEEKFLVETSRTGSSAYTWTMGSLGQVVGSSPQLLFPAGTQPAFWSVSAVPGGVGKIYIGKSTMNKATLQDVFMVLYPNSVGRWSESFYDVVDHQDKRFYTGNLYVAADAAGDLLAGHFGTLTREFDGGLRTYDGNVSSTATGSTPNVLGGSAPSLLRVQTIPGQAGKIRIFDSGAAASQLDPAYANTQQVLWPSTGNYSIGEGHSEAFTLRRSESLDSVRWFPEVSGERLIWMSR